MAIHIVGTASMTPARSPESVTGGSSSGWRPTSTATSAAQRSAGTSHSRVAEASEGSVAIVPVSRWRIQSLGSKAHRARRGAQGGRPPAFDRERYRQRHQVERLMNRRKQFRAVATRFDKLAVRYQATVCVADIFIWLRARPDQPRDDPRNTP